MGTSVAVSWSNFAHRYHTDTMTAAVTPAAATTAVAATTTTTTTIATILVGMSLGNFALLCKAGWERAGPTSL